MGYHWVARMQDGSHVVMPLDRPAEAALRLGYSDVRPDAPAPPACTALEADARRFHAEVSQCLTGAQMPITSSNVPADMSFDSLVKCSQIVETTVQAMTDRHMGQLRKAQLMLEQRRLDQLRREQEQHDTLRALRQEIETIKYVSHITVVAF